MRVEFHTKLKNVQNQTTKQVQEESIEPEEKTKLFR